MQMVFITLFPQICDAPLSHSIIGRAQETGKVQLEFVDLHDFSAEGHHQLDDYPYGGGPGMILRAEPVFRAVESVATPDSRVILLTPQGRVFDQAKAREYAQLDHLIFISGHYEGVDHRVAEHLAHEELSIGDYVLTNGALAAAVVADAVIRLIPGVLGDARSPQQESFSAGQPALLEAPQYTKPRNFRGHLVPDILLSGHHGAIEAWRREQAILRTRQNRPDLLED